ncbi:GNAT family N-acetyltransferase [Roseovarius aestuariivivens]|uniref:GNAT family N-acetyltransferase n=1 Tax=Roseovarius aestuariivivens TaxID=1888910 RepID=UPI00143695C1|nr:GNAT family N-acetyltransferase [Roseovarius aestuariivivens]
MDIEVRQFQPDDADSFRMLHRACLAHYRIAPATRAQEDRVLACLIAERHIACHLAFADRDPVGFATWGLSFPAGPGVSLVMKELFVSSQARRWGVGRALLSALVDVARDEGCERLDWATDGNNAGARLFYESIGAPRHFKENYRVPREAFDAFQADLGSG